LKISFAPAQGEADFLRLPLGIKGKKSQDKKNGAFWSGFNVNILRLAREEVFIARPCQKTPNVKNTSIPVRFVAITPFCQALLL